jgi:glycosyltransferase involved in cell wall biosynthesis
MEVRSIEHSPVTKAPLRKPVIGVLANIYEADAGIRAGGHLHFIQVVKRWTEFDIVLFAPEIARRDFAKALPQARFVAMPALPPASPKFLDFLYRSVLSVIQLRDLRSCDAFLATSHLLVDVVPAVLSRKPVAVISHHLIGSEIGKNARKSWIPVLSERFALWATRFGDVRAFITSSNLVAAELRAQGLKMPIVVSTNGVDHIAEGPAANLAQAGREGALFLGRLHRLKNVVDAIRAWRLVVDRFPTERLSIIGAPTDTAYLSELQNAVAELDLSDRVSLVGSVSEADKSLALTRAKLFLFPSGEEGWGIALAEAMRAGLPCVTYDLPIFAEIFPAGRLAAPIGDVAALARCVIELLSDEPLRLRFAAEASALAKTFSWDRASRITASVFREILP